MMLAVSPTGRVEAIYNQIEQVNGVRNRCYFLLAGQASDGIAKVTSWGPLPPVLAATLRWNANGVQLQMPSGRDHPGCRRVLPSEIDSIGIELKQEKQTDWIGLDRVLPAQIQVYAGQSGVKIGIELVHNDVLGVISRAPGWVQVERPSGEKMIRGWIKSSELEPIGIGR